MVRGGFPPTRGLFCVINMAQLFCGQVYTIPPPGSPEASATHKAEPVALCFGCMQPNWMAPPSLQAPCCITVSNAQFGSPVCQLLIAWPCPCPTAKGSLYVANNAPTFFGPGVLTPSWVRLCISNR